MPPFRTYLVLSVIFFVIAFFNPREDFALLYEPEVSQAPEINATTDDGDVDITINGASGSETKCNFNDENFDEMPAWIQKRATPERLARICERIEFDEGDTFAELLLDRIPIALIVLLPLMALVLKLLYPLSRRYFVEHLLFFVHYHAFFFLILTLMILFQRMISLLPLNKAVMVLPLVVASFYIPVYLYKGMHRVYAQGHVITILKYLVLLVTYITGVSLTFLGALLFAAISI